MTTTTTLVLLPVPPPLALQLPHWLMRGCATGGPVVEEAGGRPCAAASDRESA